MNRFNKVALAVALCALSIGLIAAQQRGGGGGKHGCQGPNKEMVAALKTWAQTNVLPQLRTWKATLDGAMSAEDLQKLNALRARATQLRKDAMAAGAAMHAAPKGDDDNQQNRDKMKAFGDQRKALLDELRPIAEKYRPTLQTIGAEAMPKIESWKAEGKAVAEKWMQEHKDQAQAADSTGEHHGCRGGKCGMGAMRGMMGGHGDMNPRAMAARFMLWDGNDPMDQVGQFGGEGSAPGLK